MAVTLERKTQEQIELAIISLDDGAKNVINHQVLDELEAAWLEAQSASAIVFSGRPGSFCAGYDVSVMTGGDASAASELGRRGGRLALELYACDKPVVAVSTGHAFTIGAVWLACCDVRIGEQGRFKYGMTEVALGVGFSPWPLVPLRERLATQHQLPALAHSRVYDPEGALAAGFIDELVAADQGMARALEVAAQLAQLPAKAYAVTKQQLRHDGVQIMAADLGLSTG